MHIFFIPSLIGNVRCDVAYDEEVLQDWDFPLIRSDSGCSEVNIRMVYCAAFDCNANSSKDVVTCSWFKFPMEQTLF